MKERLEGKVALVTGGGSGIGRASALAFARKGAQVVVADADVAGGEETIHMVKAIGVKALFVKTDVSKAVEVEGLTHKAMKTYGHLDCAFNNAGINEERDLIAQGTEAMWDRIISVNLKGIWLCMRYEIPAMLKHGAGAIVNTASILGLTGSGRGVSAYVASKHGVIGLTKAAALEYAKDGIRVNAVCPGVIRTAMYERREGSEPEVEARHAASIPLGRIGGPEEVAAAVVWLCSDAASFVTGHALVVDGGDIV